MKTLAEQLGISEELLSSLHISKENPEAVLRALAGAALFQARKVSIGKAAEIAGMDRISFETFLTDLGIPNSLYDVEELESDLKTLGLK